MRKNHKVKGFTLIELIVVIAIFGIIMAGALNLLQPSRTLFNKSFSEESMVSGATQINNYLEESLKYANVIRITTDAPTTANLKDIIDECYLDKLNVKDPTHDPEPAKGQIHVLEVNNKPDANGNTGVIRMWTYDYVAGGHVKTDGSEDAAKITGPTTHNGDYAVNLALYNDFNYTISLGVFEKKIDSTNNTYYIAKNDTYYSYNSANPFGIGNFGFTVTAYPRRLTNPEQAAFGKVGITETRFDRGSGAYGYTNCGVYANGIQFENYWDNRSHTPQTYDYLVYKIGADNKKETADGKNVYETKPAIPATTRYKCYATEPQMNPDHFYITYTYNENEIITS